MNIKIKTLKVNLRDKFGTNFSKKLRALHQIPAVIYCKSYINNIHIWIEESLLFNIKSYTKKEKILISILNKHEEKNIIVNIQEIQFHPFKNKLLHIDFLKIY